MHRDEDKADSYACVTLAFISMVPRLEETLITSPSFMQSFSESIGFNFDIGFTGMLFQWVLPSLVIEPV